MKGTKIEQSITLTCMCNVYQLIPHLFNLKLGFSEIYLLEPPRVLTVDMF